MKKDDEAVLLTRRSALGLIGGAVGTMSLAARAGGLSSAGSCTLTPEGEVGPYFTDDSASGYNRRDIRSNLDGTDTQTGVPLILNIYVYDYDNGCVAMPGAQIDIWHCNAAGLYSNESKLGTSGQSWLRGYQLTDSTGAVAFRTIMPGWYSGRATHIHLRVRSSYDESSSPSDGSNTTQVFFPQKLVDTIDTSVSPYSAEGKNPTTNAKDRVYADQTQGKMLLTPTGSLKRGFVATAVIGLPITVE